MILELKPEQQEILEMATRSGMRQEEVLDQAFAIIREQHEIDAWMLANREEIAAHIEEGFAQAERGELIPDYEVKRILQERRRQRDIA
jgi:predicted transcriptional regulator